MCIHLVDWENCSNREKRSNKKNVALEQSKVLHCILHRLGKEDTDTLQDHTVKAKYLNKDARVIFSPIS